MKPESASPRRSTSPVRRDRVESDLTAGTAQTASSMGTLVTLGSYQTTDSEREKAQRILNSFKKPDRLILAICATLSVCAGTVNAISFRSLGSLVSHTTGSTTKIGLFIQGSSQGHAGEEYWDAAHCFLLVLSFIIGASICGVLVMKNELNFGKSLYGVALLANSALLIIATVIQPYTKLSVYMIAAACGLQNGVCTVHWGAVVRTTHVTGLATDLGLAIGRLLAIRTKFCYNRFNNKTSHLVRVNAVDRAEAQVDLQKMVIFVTLWCSYLTGSLAGAFLSSHFGIQAMFFPAGVTGSLGVSYAFVKSKLQARYDRSSLRRLSSGMTTLRRSFSGITWDDANSRGLPGLSAAENTELQQTISEMQEDLESLRKEISKDTLTLAKGHSVCDGSIDPIQESSQEAV